MWCGDEQQRTNRWNTSYDAKVEVNTYHSRDSSLLLQLYTVIAITAYAIGSFKREQAQVTARE